MNEIINKQREYFYSNQTRNIKTRINNLKLLRKSIISNYDKILDAFLKDFNKCEFDVVSTEIAMVLTEIDYFIKNIKKLSKVKKVKGNIINFPSKSYIYSEPYGVCLIMSPWNYPIQLSLTPLASAVACGNVCVLKPSDYAHNVSLVIKEICKVFSEKLVYVALGGRVVNEKLLDQKYDYIFFTGSVNVGKIVMEKASYNLTPVTLELGGKSPTIVCSDADIETACKRIVWAKYLNAGQTCVAPDYILVHKDIAHDFIYKCIEYINRYYFHDDILNKDFPKIINEKHYKRLLSLIDYEKVVYGGKHHDRTIYPTIITNVISSDKIMQEEIFGPLMPVIEFENLDNVIYELKRKQKPLALYIFSKDINNINKVLNNVSSGGACVNDCIMHLTNHHLPFGGVGSSGMGAYHGKKSFETFTHQKSVFVKGKREINVKYPPYSKKKLNFIKKIMNVK